MEMHVKVGERLRVRASGPRAIAGRVGVVVFVCNCRRAIVIDVDNGRSSVTVDAEHVEKLPIETTASPGNEDFWWDEGLDYPSSG